MLVIGLTGGIGSGKSTVSKMLGELGGAVFDADKLGHQVLEPGNKIHQDVVEAFGKDILSPDGRVDRKKLGKIVFEDASARARLNAIMHPRMYRIVEKRLAEMKEQGVKVAVLEAALLVEAGWQPLADEIWVTTAPVETILKRLANRDGFQTEQSLARIRSQISSDERTRHADVIVDTDCSMEELGRRVRRLWEERVVKNAKAGNRR